MSEAENGSVLWEGQSGEEGREFESQKGTLAATGARGAAEAGG